MTASPSSGAGPRVVAIGGGHGLAMSLRAIHTYAGHLTAVVATGDDGGSSGRIRSELAMPAPGDLRRCLSALAPDSVAADGFEHRFGSGSLAGHAVGNLVLAGLVDAGHDLAGAADLASIWLGIDPTRVRVLPATAVRGQVAVEEAAGVRSIRFDPPSPAAPPEVPKAIGAADQVVLGPGSFFTSILGAAAVPEIVDAISAVTAPVTLVANLDVAADEQVDRLRTHGIEPTHVVVQTGAGAADIEGVTFVEADVVRPHGLAHDADRLAPVLASILD